MMDYNEFLMTIITAGCAAEYGKMERAIFTAVWAEVVASSDCE